MVKTAYAFCEQVLLTDDNIRYAIVKYNNLQRVKIMLPNGQVRRVWVAVKAIKAGLVEKLI